jgi:hypothetical protein
MLFPRSFIRVWFFWESRLQHKNVHGDLVLWKFWNFLKLLKFDFFFFILKFWTLKKKGKKNILEFEFRHFLKFLKFYENWNFWNFWWHELLAILYFLSKIIMQVPFRNRIENEAVQFFFFYMTLYWLAALTKTNREIKNVK